MINQKIWSLNELVIILALDWLWLFNKTWNIKITSNRYIWLGHVWFGLKKMSIIFNESERKEKKKKLILTVVIITCILDLDAFSV